ncbi:FUSC family protein [Rhizobium sp. Root1220]|uniref:FUSC family protein n=1 Tax=Rhizobium sp. Root1220 TaxID=1736432 RepID=UPI0009EC01CA|nr:FUSC family protein [Rhizobium sp. Root1220]
MSADAATAHVSNTVIVAARRLFSVDLGWRNFLFSARTAGAAILALAIAYRLELKDPQWATLTVYLLAQPTVGAALSKGTWRAIGTVGGGAIGLAIAGMFSQAPHMLVAATVFVVGVSFYVGARLRNFVSYGVLLGGYTALLIAYEGSSDPLQAWSIAVDRIGAILIGIGCGTAASMLIFPRYAGDALRESLASTFRDLAGYTAIALRLSAPPEVFARMRQQMVAKVVSFDALRSSALFEAPEMRASAKRLRRILREFLVVLSVARGLFVRLDAFEGDGAAAVRDRLVPALEAIAVRIEQVAANPLMWRNPGTLRSELRAMQRALDEEAAELEKMAGKAPFDALANGILILERVAHLLRSLATIAAAESAGADNRDTRSPSAARHRPDPEGRREALLIAIRAAFAMLMLSIMWMASGWNEGFTAVSGGAIMLFFAVNQDNPQAAARTYLVWTGCGILLSYLAMIFVLPRIEGFGTLAIVLLLLLLPAGLMIGTPNRSLAGIAFGGFAISYLSTGNVFTPDEIGFVSSAIAILLGMVVCLAVIVALPVTSKARREQSWRRTIGGVLPAVARGMLLPRRGADEIGNMLAALLPRLALDRQSEEEFLRGMLGAASSTAELGRLVDLKSQTDMPRDVARAIESFLSRFATALERFATERNADRQVRFAEAEALVTEMLAWISARPLSPGPSVRSLLCTGASLRFLADRFDIDRAYLLHDFDGD